MHVLLQTSQNYLQMESFLLLQVQQQYRSYYILRYHSQYVFLETADF